MAPRFNFAKQFEVVIQDRQTSECTKPKLQDPSIRYYTDGCKTDIRVGRGIYMAWYKIWTSLGTSPTNLSIFILPSNNVFANLWKDFLSASQAILKAKPQRNTATRMWVLGRRGCESKSIGLAEKSKQSRLIGSELIPNRRWLIRNWRNGSKFRK